MAQEEEFDFDALQDEQGQAQPLATPATEKQNLSVLQLKNPDPKLTKVKEMKKRGGTKKRKTRKGRKSRKSKKTRKGKKSRR